MSTEQDLHDEAGILAKALARLSDFCSRHPWTVLAGTVLSCIVCVVYFLLCVTYHTQRNDIHNPNKDYYRRWQQYVAEFGDDDDLVVVVQGAERGRMEQGLEALAARIQQRPDHFDRLFYKVDLMALKNRALMFLPTDQVRQVQDHLKSPQMLLLLEVPNFLGWKSLTLAQLLAEGKHRLTNHDATFLRQLAHICQTGSDFLNEPEAYRSPWQSFVPGSGSEREASLEKPNYFFSGDETLAFLLVRPKKDEAGFTFAQKNIDAMKALMAEVEQDFPGLEIGLTGLPVLENDEIVASQNDSKTASWWALVGVALLYLVAYRGFRYPFMTVSALLVGTIWALGWLTLTVGHLNILSSAFAVMLIGLGDYGVLWVTRFGQERQTGADLHTATERTALSVGPGIMTAALTTACAFFAAMLADLRAVSELGWIAGCGVLFCALSCFIVMPALLSIFDFQPQHSPDVLSLQKHRVESRQWLPGLTHRPQWIIPISLALTALLFYFAWGTQYDHNLLRLQAAHLESVQWEKKLIEKTEGASWHALSYTTTPEEAIALKARFEQLPEVSRVVEIASLVPREQPRKIEMMRDIQIRLRRLPERGQLLERPAPKIPELIQACMALEKAVAQSGQAPPPGLVEGLHALRTQVEKQGDASGEALRQFEQFLSRDLAEDLHRLRDVSVPHSLEVADLPVSLKERYLGKNGKWLLRVFAKECLWDYEPLQQFAGKIRTVDTEATGKPFTTLEGLKVMRMGFFWAGLYALIAMVFVLLLDFESVRHTAIALAPLFMGMVASLGLMTLLGVPLNPANMIAFPLILGVGADNGVHVLHDFRSRNRSQVYSLSYSTGRSIMVSALTTILGFGTLMVSQHRGLASLGLVLTLGVSCCMLTALVFLPALLRAVSIQRMNAARVALEDKRRAQIG